MPLGQEPNGDNLGKSFRSSKQQWYVECTHTLYEAILMSTHDIQFHDKINKIPKVFVFLELSVAIVNELTN